MSNTTSLHKQMQSPESIFQSLFECYHFREISEQLEQIKFWLINKNYTYEINSREHDNVLYFFERMQALVEAAHVFEQQRQKNEALTEAKLTEGSTELFHMLFDKVDALFDAGSYLHQKNQNGLSCYFLKKAVLCAYNALISATTYSAEETFNLEELAKICSIVFKGLPNPFAAQNIETNYLQLLNTMNLHGAFTGDLKIEDDVIEYLLKEVAIIRRDICSYYESLQQPNR